MRRLRLFKHLYTEFIVAAVAVRQAGAMRKGPMPRTELRQWSKVEGRAWGKPRGLHAILCWDLKGLYVEK